MQEGKISESVLRRTIFKSISNRKDEIHPYNGQDSAHVRGSNVLSSVSVAVCRYLQADYAMKSSIINGINNIAVNGGCANSVAIGIVLPENSEEDVLRILMETANNTALSYNLTITGGHTTISSAVNYPIVTTTVLGERYDNMKINLEDDNNALSIVMSGYAGFEGSSLISKSIKEEINSSFTEAFLDNAEKGCEALSVNSEAAVAIKHGVKAMHDIHEGGVYEALWSLGDKLKTMFGFGGMSIDLRNIPIKQETIEICERVDANPYFLSSMGALLMITDRPDELKDMFINEGFNAEVIGTVNSGNDRVLYNKGEKRFLDKSRGDELYRILRLKEDNLLCVRKY